MLNDFQKLLGDINWLKPQLEITTGQLQALFDILRGDSDLSSPRELTPAAKRALHLVNKAMQNTRVYRIDLSLPLILIICSTKPLPTGVIWQKPRPVEWLHLRNSASKILNPCYDLTDGAECTTETLPHSLPSKVQQFLSCVNSLPPFEVLC